MKVTFIKPNMGLVRGRPYLDRGRMEPLTFAVLAGQLPPDVTCVLYDDRCEKIPYDEPTGLVAISVEIYTARRAYEIAENFRRRGVPVVLGGYHVTMLPAEALQYSDAVLLGDAEGVWPQVVADAAAGRLRRVYRAAGPLRLDGLRTRWDLFTGKSYLPVRLTQFSRGCINLCEFCATGTIYRRTHTCRPPAEVIDELAAQPSPFVFFVDDNIVGNFDQAKELLRRLIPLRKRWIGQASMNFTKDPELLELIVRSGCAGLVVGFESIERRNLALMKKDCNREEIDYEEAIARMKGIGLQLWAAFLLGYDHDDLASINKTVDWALGHRFCFAAFNILSPYPSTALYEQFRQAGRLLHDRWWLAPDYHFGDAVFRPARMSPDELTDACFWARRRFNNPLSILWRATDPQTNAKDLWSLVTYFTYNPLFRRELYKKHGMRLGYWNRLPTPQPLSAADLQELGPAGTV